MAGEGADSEGVACAAVPDRVSRSPVPDRVSPPRGTECHDEVCVTCSDLAVQVRIVRLLADGLAVVDTGSGEEEISVALVDAHVGDDVLVHAKEAIAVVDRAGQVGRR